METKIITPLTAREKEVFELMKQGKTSKQIAELLHRSIYTVNTHRETILWKLNAHTTIEAINNEKKLHEPD